MPKPEPTELRTGGVSRRGRLEIGVVFAIIAAVIVVGSLYVAFFGSPTRNRAAADSSSAGPAIVGGKVQTPPKPVH